MAKRGDGPGPRRLRTVKPGETPAEPFAPSEAQTKYLDRIVQAMAAGVDQFVTVCCHGGFIVDFVAYDDHRHHVKSVLDEAPEVYDVYSSPVYVTED